MLLNFSKSSIVNWRIVVMAALLLIDESFPTASSNVVFCVGFAASCMAHDSPHLALGTPPTSETRVVTARHDSVDSHVAILSTLRTQ